MSNYGIIGWPLEKTYSPIIQNYLFNMNNLDSQYQPFKIENLTTESVDTLIADLNGFNITIPHKEKILNLDERVQLLDPDDMFEYYEDNNFQTFNAIIRVKPVCSERYLKYKLPSLFKIKDISDEDQEGQEEGSESSSEGDDS